METIFRTFFASLKVELSHLKSSQFEKKNRRPRPPIFFAFCIAQSQLSLKIYLQKVLELMNPYKKFISENTEFRYFRAIMHPEIIIFGEHVKFP